MNHTERHFRAGVGTVIYNEAGDVLLFRRNAPPAETWQFQQGGIDSGESVETTLWRELKEETGIARHDVATVIPYPEWTLQEYPADILNAPDQPNPDRLGQVHRWFYLLLNDAATIDLAKASDEEFSAWKWVSWDEALATAPPYKAHIYRTLYEYFSKHIKIV